MCSPEATWAIKRLLLLWLLALAVPAVAGPRIAIIDRFFPPLEGFASNEARSRSNLLYGLVDLDQDHEREAYYHGDLVHIIAAHPQFSFLHYPMRAGPSPMAEILANLRKMRVRQERYPVDALILSWESSTLISAFETPLRLEHAAHYKALLRDWGKQYSVWRDTYAIILELEALVRAGVQVYTIAGNGGSRMVNTFSFAEGVITVGAREAELNRFVADNAFVDAHEQAAYFIRRVDDAAGRPLGYDVDGDGCVDIPLSRLSAANSTLQSLPQQYWQPITGSSFAAPMALRRDLLAQARWAGCSAERARF